MKLRTSAEDATWQLRETAWDIQERLLWRSADVAREKKSKAQWRIVKIGRAALYGAERVSAPVQKWIETHLVWPLTDRLEDYGPLTRTAVATLGVVAAIGAGIAGARSAIGGESAAPPAVAAAVPVAAPAASPPATLEGVAPDFTPQAAAPAPASGADSTAAAAVPAAPVTADPAAPPELVALGFAQAFVQYEVGQVDEKTAQTFAAVSSKPLAKALSADPPRLPAGTEVPLAKVLNVVLSEQEGKEIVASVSLLRLKAASELRLTLRNEGKGWRVVEVLG